MHMMKTIAAVAVLAVVTLVGALTVALAAEDPAPLDEVATRARAAQLARDGNHAEAFDLYRGLALRPDVDPRKVGEDLGNALRALQQVNRVNEFDVFREQVIALHAHNWRLLTHAAGTMFMQPNGVIIAGEFVRGPHRGGTGRHVSSHARDRARALQLLEQAMALHGDDEPDGHFLYRALVSTLYEHHLPAWKLQVLTDLQTLPDYEEQQWRRHGMSEGAPTNADGSPVFHAKPETWDAARTDGERWRWVLGQLERYAPQQAKRIFADFLYSQFGVHTMASYGWYLARPAAEEGDESGTFALHTLGEDETIARLATGVKRFKLPDEFNYIRRYQELAEEADGHGRDALERLVEIFRNRRQYPEAAGLLRQLLDRFGRKDHWREQLAQIENAWGAMEPLTTQPAGRAASFEFRFRNGKQVSFEARPIDVRRLLDDVKAYLKSNPNEMDWDRQQIENLGHRLVTRGQDQYAGEKVAAWTLDLEPRPDHFDKRITVATPLQKAGAYLVTATMAAGNMTHLVLWVADTVIVQKPMADKQFVFVADAVTGRPIHRANVEFFGFWQEWTGRAQGARRYELRTRNFAEFTGDGGYLMLPTTDADRNYQWLMTATTGDGRLAYLGWTHAWTGGYHDRPEESLRAFVITDRPVYRPGDAARFKVWVNQSKYAGQGPSPVAGQTITVRIHDPRGEKVHEQTYTADEFGGIDGSLELLDEATLGVYSLNVVNHGGGSFRVEEYKKPEFEVTIAAPDKPVMLGDSIEATVKANYYFGAPVVNATVKYRVLRHDHDARWFPPHRWDWLYGNGFWWFGYDYAWYPGWRHWGCVRPSPWWWGWRPSQPELVAEGEAPIGGEGTFAITIDTALAKEVFADRDHRYEITAEVTDQSRRTIIGQGQVLVARQPFKVYAWVERGYFRTGDVVHAHFRAATLDQKPVAGAGALLLYPVSYENGEAIETPVEEWELASDEQGEADVRFNAAQPGQYRLSYKVTDAAERTMEGGYVFIVRGEDFQSEDYRFNDLELVPDRQTYAVGADVQLMINTQRADSVVLLFVRPVNGTYLEPKVLRLEGKSTVEAIAVTQQDMPNFFVEALTVADGKVFNEARQIVVPPESRVVDVAVELDPPAAPGSAGGSDAQDDIPRFRPGAKTNINLTLTGPDGKPFVGSTVVAVYDKAVEYISGGSNVGDIKAFFWSWRRDHQPQGRHNLDRGETPIAQPGKPAMGYLGIFGHTTADEWSDVDGALLGRQAGALQAAQEREMPARAAPVADFAKDTVTAATAPLVEPTVRQQFADTALWVAALTTDENGKASAALTLPDNLTTWKAKVWAMGPGARVGQGERELITTKDLIVRLQAPRFFVQKDEVVLSANVHNYLCEKKTVEVTLTLPDDLLDLMDEAGGLTRQVEIEADGEARVDWRVRVVTPGEATISVAALTDEESDAVQMSFPVYVHGMLKTESFTGVIRPESSETTINLRVPQERMPEQSRLEIRYSPTLAGAMVDALPYLVGYPYGCTEQTLNRFLPTVITQNVLRKMGVNLADVKEKRANLNAQEIGDDAERAAQWQRFDPRSNPVFDDAEVQRMVKAGLERLTNMQLSDGGWGWFSGWGEQSTPHTTALVVRGLQVARANEVAIVPGVIERGVEWLKQHQAEQVRRLKLPPGHRDHKSHANNMDAFAYAVLVDEKFDHEEMRAFLYRDREKLSVYAKAMFALALHRAGHAEQRDMLRRNVEQFLVHDDENQTAWLNLNNGGYWWWWYGSEYEAHAYYLKLLAAVEPEGETASRLVKYLVNNRKHATYWNSTRDTALVVEAMADYITASGEMAPDMTLTIAIDGQPTKEVRITRENLFTFDNKLVLAGDAVTTGAHTVTLTRTGQGPVYFNAYLTNFTLEDPITKAGLEIKVERKYYKLEPVEQEAAVRGARGQAVGQRVEKYHRVPIENFDTVTSGDLIEIELTIESKNDYEYLMFEDMKAAGFEPVQVQSGYNGNDLGAYMELRDERVTFFVARLARGRHSVSYRMFAQTPGSFSALPTKASAMYAPELRANSDELKVRIEDR